MALGDYKTGDSGPGVLSLQAYLQSVGISVSQTGSYDAGTRDAVIKFQRARKIAVDGIAGPQTLIELSKARGEGWKYTEGWRDAGAGAGAGSGSGSPPPKGSPSGIQPWMILAALAVIVLFSTGGGRDSGNRGYGRLRIEEFDSPSEGEDEEEEEEEEDEGD